MKVCFVAKWYDGGIEPSTTVTHEADVSELPEILAAIEAWLKGCGFEIQGSLEMVPYPPLKPVDG